VLIRKDVDRGVCLVQVGDNHTCIPDDTDDVMSGKLITCSRCFLVKAKCCIRFSESYVILPHFVQVSSRPG
jgi:hypothetical protein